jgi:hypothetical protein
VRPVFLRKPKRVLNHVRICFLAYWISARLATQWRALRETGEVTSILRELQSIRLGQISIGEPGSAFLARPPKFLLSSTNFSPNSNFCHFSPP